MHPPHRPLLSAATGGLYRVCLLTAGVVLVLAAPLAWGDFFFYGVAEDQFLLDNDMLWDAMDDFPEWVSTTPDLKDDRLGKAVGGERDSIYEDLEWYASQVGDGDVFVFAYAGHGGWTTSDANGDEGTAPAPVRNDPSPSVSPPYAGDEFFGKAGGYYMYDDDFMDVLAHFDPGAEVIVISGACFSGGWVGGTTDLNATAPASNNGLFAMLAVPENDTGIALGPVGNTNYYSILFLRALAATVQPGLTAQEWFQAAVDYGAHQRSYVAMPWGTAWYYWWPEPGWQPSPDDLAFYDYDNDSLDHWGWQETYLQLTPVSYSTLDADHDKPLFTPEPGVLLLMVIGAGVVGVAFRRRRTS